MSAHCGNKRIASWTLIAAIAFLLPLSSCVSPERKAAIAELAQRQIICTKGDDCETKWGLAVAWVMRNSSWKIQLQNDLIIQTYSAVGGSPSPAFLVNKVPLGNGQFHITMSSGCDNIFGCVPDHTTLLASFNQFVDSVSNAGQASK